MGYIRHGKYISDKYSDLDEFDAAHEREVMKKKLAARKKARAKLRRLRDIKRYCEHDY